MSVYTTLDGRVVMDQAAFARFSETRSMRWCSAGGAPKPPRWTGRITIDADTDTDKITLEAAEQTMRNLRLLSDLHKAAQAGRVDGAFMSASTDGDRCLEAFVFENSELSAGWGGCLNSPVDVGPVTTFRSAGTELFRRADGNNTKHRVTRHAALEQCCCGGYDEAIGEPGCVTEYRSDTFDETAVDIADFMPPPATGQLEQALVAAAGTVNKDGLMAIGKVAWNATGPGQRNMFRAWLGTFNEAVGGRRVTWVPDLFGDTRTVPSAWLAELLRHRPVCANTDGTVRGPCPAFLAGPAASSTIRVPAHVDSASLADAAKLAADGADPAAAVAIIAAITHPDRK